MRHSNTCNWNARKEERQNRAVLFEEITAEKFLKQKDIKPQHMNPKQEKRKKMDS